MKENFRYILYIDGIEEPQLGSAELGYVQMVAFYLFMGRKIKIVDTQELQQIDAVARDFYHGKYERQPIITDKNGE